jgi:hypothetical protein
MCSAHVAPPNAAAVDATTVIPICTVARKRSGSPRSRARYVPAELSVASSETRVARMAMTAISAAANMPFKSVSATMIESSMANDKRASARAP